MLINWLPNCAIVTLGALFLLLPAFNLSQPAATDHPAYEPVLAESNSDVPATESVTPTLYLPLVRCPLMPTPELQNGGFEDGWWRQTHTGQEFGEIFVPEHWVAYWKEGGTVPHDPGNPIGYGRPEMRVIRAEPPFLNPPRLHEDIDQDQLGNQNYLDWLLAQGWHSLQYFTFYRIHDAGVYQTVEGITPGSTLRLSGWAHAWSGNGTYDSAACSEGEHVGCGAFYALQGTENLDDGDRNFTFRLGIDPTGGTDPWADSVIWGTGAHIYNVYAEVPQLSVQTEAPAATVFLRSEVLWPFRNCDSYWDDIELEIVAP